MSFLVPAQDTCGCFFQEHLVTRHAETETKIRGQALDLVDTADEQYADIQKLQESLQRKR